MPNYGKEYTRIKKKVLAEKKRHSSKKASFGNCNCNKIEGEIEEQYRMAFGKGQFGKACAFERLMNFFRFKKDEPMEEVEMDAEPIFDGVSRFYYDAEGRKHIVRGEARRNIPKTESGNFGYQPRLWESYGPFYNTGYYR